MYKAEMAERMKEESMDIIYQEQPDQRQNAILNDNSRPESPRVDPSQVNNIVPYCRVCKNNKCKMDLHKVESFLHIPLGLRYFIEEDDIHNIKLDVDCNLHEYMVWQYLMNSPRQCEKFNTGLSTERLNITILNSSSIAINSPVTDKSDAIKLTTEVVEHVFIKLGQVLNVESFSSREGTVEDNVGKLNEIFGQEVAYASEVETRIFIVFPNSGKEFVDKCIQKHIDGSERREITETVILEHVFKKFQEEIDKCVGNTNISHTLEEVDNQYICKLSGPKDYVDPAVLKLKQVKANLKHKYVKITKRSRNALKHLNVEDRINSILKTSFSSCVIEQTDKDLLVYSFDSNVLSDASNFLENLVLDYVFPIHGNARRKIGEIVTHLQSKYKGKIIVGTDDKCQLYLFGLRPDVDEARSELVDLQDGKKSLNTAMHMVGESLRQNCSKIYEVRNSKHLKYLQNSVFIAKIEDRFKVKVTFVPEKYVLEISGSEKDVISAVKCVKIIGQELFSDIYIVSQKAAVHFFESESSRDFICAVERESDVYLEKQSETIFGDEKMQVTKLEHNDYNQWTVFENKSLFLEQCSVEEAIADVKIVPSTHDTQKVTGASIVKGQHHVDLKLPRWIDGSQSECELYKETLGQAFQELNKTREKSVIISLKQRGKWTFQHLMSCTVDFAVKWLLSDRNTKLSKVRLCPGRDGFFDTDVYIDKCLENMISDFQKKDELRLTVCNGELDKMKADVLVNTAAANLDLSKGHVSAAILKRAGRDLQKECHKRYRNGIGHGEIAETNGYNTACKNIYHMALQPYSKTATTNCIENLRNAMSRCLHTASDSGHTSIAFPAMGTGSLGYPVEIVSAEMFGCVERFKRDCPHTTLKVITFVIYHRDDQLFQYFKNIELGVVKSTGRHRQIRIEILGTKENVNHSRKLLEGKVQEFRKLPASTDKQGNISTCHINPEQTNGNTLAPIVTSKCDNAQKASSLESSDINSGKSKEGDRVDKSTLVCKRYQKVYERPFSWSKDAKHVEIFKCNECFVRVYIGDIMNAPVDCIVNASQGGIKHGLGNGSAAGENVKEEAKCWIQKNDKTGPSIRLNGKCVMNAVFPCWNRYKLMTRPYLQKCSENVKRTIIDCLHLAADGNIRSIAFPLKISGFFNIPQDICAIEFLEAVKTFTRNNNIVNEIHFIDETFNFVEIIQKTFKSMLDDGQQTPNDIGIYLDTPSIDGSGVSAKEKNNKAVIKNTEMDKLKYVQHMQHFSVKEITQHEAEATFIADKNTLKCFFSPDYIAEVYDGDIMSISGVEAIVCSENRRGDAKGMIASALIREGDDRYRKAKQAKFASSTNYGDIITTQGRVRGFKWVIHAIISRRSVEIPVIYKKVFNEAKNRNITSLALPLLGAGKIDMDPITIAEIFLSEMIHFFNQNMKENFTLHVHVVLNDQQIATVVKDLFKTRINHMNKSHENKDEQRIGPILEEIRVNCNTYEEGTEEMKDELNTQFDTSTINSASKAKEQPADDCVICMDKVTDALKLVCGHTFCKECIEGYFRIRKVCPTCGKVCGVITGDQPGGKMEIVKRQKQLEGYKGYNSLAITYSFASGQQGADHPKPGAQYKAITRTAYLPDNMEGREICALLKVAFERRLVFTIGTSRTTGQEGVITWNDIHHKTDIRPNTQFGYPDNTYLRRVREELEVKGVTKEDVDKTFIKKLDKDNFRQIIY